MSDVDIAIVSDKSLTPMERVSIVTDVDEELFYAVDFRIVSTNEENLKTTKFLDVNYHIQREGIIIYEQSYNG